MTVILIKIIFGILVVLLVIYTNISAQVDGTSSPQSKKTTNKADQNLKSIARVNPSTLAMEMNLPLITYPGRNGNSLPVGFSYSSKLWRMQGGTPWWYWANTHKKYVTDIHTVFAEKTAAGWTSNLVPPRIEEKSQIYDETGQQYNPVIDAATLNTNWENILSSFSTASLMSPCQGFVCCTTYWCEPDNPYDPNTSFTCTCTRWEYGGGGIPEPGPLPPPPPQVPLQLYYVRRFNVTMPDGSTHEFRSGDSPTPCGDTNTQCTLPSSSNGTYLSVDGSGLKLVKTEGETNLYMPDGGRYRFPAASAIEYIDSNGNKLVFSTSTNSTTGQTTNKWIDTLGREIVDPMQHNLDTQQQSPGKTEFSLPGLSGKPQVYSVTWSLLKPRGCETSTNPNCIGTDNAVGGALEDQSQKLFYDTRYFCRGNTQTDLLAYPNDLNNPANEVLFPHKDTGIRPCNAFDVQRDANGVIILDGNNQAIPYAVRFNPVVLSEVELPNGKTYSFKYNRYGEVTKIIYPSGKFETFVYSSISPVAGVENIGYDQTNRGVTERRVYNATGTLEQRWQYNAAFVDGLYKVTITAPKADDPLAHGAKTERYLLPAASGGNNFDYDSPVGGLAYDEKVYSENDSAYPRSRTLTEWITKNLGTVARDPRVKRTVSITIENGQALATLSETEYDETGHSDPEHFSHLNVKQSKTHNYRNIPLSLAQTGTLAQIASYFSSSTVAAISETDYVYDASYKARGINSLPVESRTIDPSDNSVIAKTQTIYDNQLPAASSNYPTGYSVQNYGIGMSFDCSDDPQTPKICWESPNSPYLGKPTTSRVWNKDDNTWIETHNRYDIFGNAITARDPIGNEVATLFENSIQRPYKYAYPTRVDTPAPDPTNTHGTNEGSFSTTTYDFMTGLPLTATDEFGQTTKTEYNDPLLRPTRVFALNFTAPITETIYDDDALTVKVRKQIDANNWDEVTTFSDSLGRVIRTQAKDSQGDVFVETQYDFLGRVVAVTNPYRQGDTVLWNKTIYDELSRIKETFAPAPEGEAGYSLGTTAYDISTAPGFFGTVVITTDAAGKKSRSITNALGQLIVVDEPDNLGQLPPIPQSTPNPMPTPTPTPGGEDPNCPPPYLHCVPNLLNPEEYPSYSTIYRYNPQGKLVEVTQGQQKRYFKYDSLGRLIRVRQPEQEVNATLNMADKYNTSGQWTAGFTYDVLGNVLTATDANGVTITNTYDRASRVKTRTYSGEPAGQTTPDVSFFYDGKGLDSQQSPNYAKGKLTKVTSSVSETRYKLFDNFGRLTEMEQRTPVDGEAIATAPPRVSSYIYNLSGALIQETYPSGRVVKNEFESDGDLARIYGTANSSSPERTYANSFSYTPDGRIESLRLGNQLWEKAKFNTRLQVTELALGHGVASGDVWTLGYEYGELNPDGTTVDAAKNTGNIARQTLSFNGLAQPFVQSYKYDSLYRITEAKETSGAAQTWIQNWNYDRYGNRTGFSQNVGGRQLAINNLTLPNVDAATNRFAANQGYLYDKNGNLINDPASNGRSFIFNGDNKQTEVKNSNGVSIGKYFYDGEGRRVKKVTDSETIVFVYSNGKLIAEYSTATPPQNPTTSYTMTDQLGSPRVITNSVGEVVSRRDFMPFGEEITPDGTHRTANLKYNFGDNIRQKFTGYQKDEETQLDFAEARMYENRHGRFTAVDPLLASGKSANPQTFNRFVYVGNRPLVLSDPLGLDWWRRFNKDSGRWEFRDQDNSPGEGWNKIDFGSNYSISVPDWCWGETCYGRTATLYSNGGWDFGERARAIQSMADFFNPYSQIDPKQLGARNPQVRQAAADVIGGITGAVINGVTGPYNLAAYGINHFGGSERLPYAWEYKPDTGGAAVFYYGTNAGLIFQGGATAVSRSFATKPGQAVFWSGFPEARAAATSFAKVNGGKTVEMTFGGRALNTVSPTLRSMGPTMVKFDRFLWRQASGSFARQTSGSANVFLRYPLNSQGVWRTVEEPILRARGIDFQIFRLNF